MKKILDLLTLITLASLFSIFVSSCNNASDSEGTAKSEPAPEPAPEPRGNVRNARISTSVANSRN